nr:AI-2E family transporter [Ardenticatena sp.]
MSHHSDPARHRRPWPTLYRPLVLIGEVAVVVLLVWLARPYWSVILVAALLAYLLSMPIDWVDRHTFIPRWLAVLAAYLLLLLMVFSGPVLAIPFLVSQTQEVFQGLPEFVQRINLSVQAWLENPPTIQVFAFQYNLEPLIESLANFFPLAAPLTPPTAQDIAQAVQQVLRSAGSVVGVATGIVGRVSGFVLSTFVVFILSIYLLVDGPHWRHRLLSIVPETTRDDLDMLLDETARVWRAYFRGQLILSTVIGVMTFAGLVALGIPGAPLLALIAGLLEILPNIGPILAVIPAAFVALVQGSLYLDLPGWQVMLLVLGLYTLIQQLENNLLVPRIHHETVDLPPVVVFLAVLVGATQGGVLGAILAVPLLGTLKVWLTYAHERLIAPDTFEDVHLAFVPPSSLPEESPVLEADTPNEDPSLEPPVSDEA